MSTFKKTSKVAIIAALLLLVTVSLAQAGSDDVRPDRPLPGNVETLALDTPVVTDNLQRPAKLDPLLVGTEGRQRILVRLSEESLAEIAASNGSISAQMSQRGAIWSQQNDLIINALGLDLDAIVLAQTENALNAVALEVDASVLNELAALSDVISISAVQDYELHLTDTVPYIGGTAVQAEGFDGSGVTVAVLDSGVDYYHANLGGSGDPADFAADDPTIIEPGTFPTAKVVGGFDFTGSVWPNGPEAFDPDPLDDGPAGGHGTHVADIIGGVDGVAPGADILAVKVCSSVSSSCTGIGLIAGMDFAVDPNGDGIFDDAVDIINMSLGSNYGTAFDDDLSQAVENASALGVLTVSSAGNGSDKPYITGTPSSAPSALAVAQTAVPTAFQPLMTIDSPASIAGDYFAVRQDWSPLLTTTVTAPIIYGGLNGENLNGCGAFSTDLTGYIVLVDRGACSFSVKISNIADANGEIGIIGLIAPGEPFGGGFGGGNPTIPGYMISQADSNAIKANLPGVVATFDPSSGIPLVMHMVGSSSRGPGNGSNLLKPEIGAPGASISAVAGTGTGTEAFGGTSGASPMVAGAAALLMDAYPDRTPAEVKAVLMNTGEMDIINSPAIGGGELAPISRIGGGEVRVDAALNSPIVAYDADTMNGALSYGFHDVDRYLRLTKYVTIKNYTDERLTYSITPTFRYDNDAASGGVEISTPGQINVPPNGTQTFKVGLRVRATNLHDWTMNSGAEGANPATLTLNEYDGYLLLDNLGTTEDDDNPAHLPWHILPRQASDVRFFPEADGQIRLLNTGHGDAIVETYSLIGTSGDQPGAVQGNQLPITDLRYFGYATYPVPAGFCSANPSFILAFAFNTWEPSVSGLFPGQVGVFVDTDQDGTPDYDIFSYALDFGTGDGRSVAWVSDLSAGTDSAFFFTDHDTNSGNTVLLVCGEQLGMNQANFFDPMDVTAYAFDGYYTGIITDAIPGITISPLGEQYLAVFDDGGVGFTTLGRLERDRMTILDFGPFTNNTESGLLMMFRQGNADFEALAIPLAP